MESELLPIGIVRRSLLLVVAWQLSAGTALAGPACGPAALERGLPVPGIAPAPDLPAAMRALHVPSLSMALISGNRIAWTRAYGDASPRTLYQAASLSKTVAAVAALRLVQAGRLTLDDEVNAALTRWKIPANEYTRQHAVSLRGLLDMTAGVGVPGYAGYARGAPLPTSIDILEGRPPARSPAVRVERVPGSAYAYSGGSYQIVQQLIEARSGEPFPEAVRRLVFQPLGMPSSRYALDDGRSAPAEVARGHASDGTELEGGWREVPELAAGGLWSTPGDLARLLIAISTAATGHRSDWLDPALAREMLTRSPVGPYGLGVAVAGQGRSLVFMKRGQNVGYQAYMLMFPATGDGIVVMTGSDNGTTLETALIRHAAEVCGWPSLGVLED